MGIQYYLRENDLNGGPFIAGRVKYSGKTELERFVSILADRGSALTETDIKAVIELMTSVIADELKQGRRVVLPFGKFGVSIKGTFESVSASFNPVVNDIKLTIAGGIELQKLLAKSVTVERIEVRDRLPRLLEHGDISAKESNTTVAAGRVVTLSGVDMSFDQSRLDEGVFYVNQVDKSEIRVEEYVKVQPREIIYTAPGVVAGEDYRLEIRRRYYTDNLVIAILKKATLKGV